MGVIFRFCPGSSASRKQAVSDLSSHDEIDSTIVLQEVQEPVPVSQPIPAPIPVSQPIPVPVPVIRRRAPEPQNSFDLSTT